MATFQRGNGGSGARTDTLQSLGMVVVAVATVTRVAWGCVHAHTTFAHLVSEQLALIHICGKDGERRGTTRRDGCGSECGVGGILGGRGGVAV